MNNYSAGAYSGRLALKWMNVSMWKWSQSKQPEFHLALWCGDDGEKGKKKDVRRHECPSTQRKVINAVITSLPQFWTCSEKKKGAKIRSVLPGEFLSHFARLKDSILPAQSSSSYASVVFRARCVALRCTGLLGFQMGRKRSMFSSSVGLHVNAIPVLVAKDEDN